MSDDVDASPLDRVVIRAWRLCPAYIEVLLHCHAHCEPIPRLHAPVVVDALELLQQFGLIEADDHSGSGWRTTARGLAFVDLLCYTPIPVEATVFLDPRTGRRIG
jgi:hypothetical protein